MKNTTIKHKAHKQTTTKMKKTLKTLKMVVDLKIVVDDDAAPAAPTAPAKTKTLPRKASTKAKMVLARKARRASHPSYKMFLKDVEKKVVDEDNGRSDDSSIGSCAICGGRGPVGEACLCADPEHEDDGGEECDNDNDSNGR